MAEMTEVQRKWRDENMEAMREGVKAAKEGRITPADTFFEWMQAKYVRDIWEERITEARELLAQAEEIIGMELEPAPAHMQPDGQIKGAALEVFNWLKSTRSYLAPPEPAQTGAAAREAVWVERLREFSVILAEEVTHGTLKLGFGPDWPAKKVQLAIDRLLTSDTSPAAAALLAQGERLKGLPPIVCLCGSTRFMDTFHEVGWQKTLDGEIVLSVGVSKHLPPDHGGEFLGEDVAQALDELHKRKINLADYVMVLNVGGYIGDSTRSEIEYAEAQGKRVDYLEARAAIDVTPEQAREKESGSP